MLSLLLLAAGGLEVADLVVVNGKVWTDGHLTANTFVAIKGDRIVGIGKTPGKWISKGTQVIDAKQHWVLPGMIDAHTHIAESCVEFINDLRMEKLTSKADFVAKVGSWTKKIPQGEWVLGRGWSVESYPDKSAPTKDWIDEVTKGHPAMFTRMDGHSVLVNSAALAKAKITKDGPPDPPGGKIERDPVTHEPTGLLTDNATDLVQTPAPTPAQYDRTLPLTVAEANRFGVTSVGDIAGLLAEAAWKRYMKRADRSIRVSLYRHAPTPASIRSGFKPSPAPDWFEARGVKLYMDGSLGSRSAAMLEPFSKPLNTQPKDWKGLNMPGAGNGTYAKILAAAAERDVQVIVHAIGDAANREVLDLMEPVPNLRKLRFRVEHVQHLHPSDIARFSALGVIPSMQPYHKADDGRYCEELIGTPRSRTSYAFKDLVNSGAALAFGSDFPVVTINPWVGVATAVTGRIVTGKIWMPHQNITLDQALDSYTRRAAYANKMETRVGRLAPGYLADVLILDRALDPKGSNVASTMPSHVIVGGRVVVN